MARDPLFSPACAEDELDRQYDNRGAVPGHPAFLARWAEASSDWRSTWQDWETLRYDPAPRCTLDLFRSGARHAPLQVFFHGGYWQALSGESFSFVAEPWLQAGVSVAVVNYPLCPAVMLDAIVHSARQAVLYLWRNAERLGCDRTRIQLSGHSAGGHLVGMVLATDWHALAADVPEPPVHSAVSLSGLFLLGPLRFTRVNEALGLDPEAARRNSPALLPRTASCPLMLAVGDRESAEYHRQSAALAAAWGTSRPAPELRILEGHHHFSVLDPWTDRRDPLFRAALHWLESSQHGAAT